MLKILLSGACGKMGKTVALCAQNDETLSIICGVDKFKAEQYSDFPVYGDFDSVKEKPDVIIDFSSADNLSSLLDFALSSSLPIVIATTGYSDEQIAEIKKASEKIPVFFTFNFSLGVNLLTALSKKAASVLGDSFDIEIIEKHHNQKIDAPSGTALMLADAINGVADNKYSYEFDRHSRRMKRPQNEIGIHSVRGGTIVGEHEVIFAGEDEVVTLSHSAYSKKIFANGALKAASFIKDKKSGIFDMNDILSL